MTQAAPPTAPRPPGMIQDSEALSGLGSNPDPTWYQLCDLGKPLSLSEPSFPFSWKLEIKPPS